MKVYTDILGRPLHSVLARPGAHIAVNALATLLAAPALRWRPLERGRRRCRASPRLRVGARGLQSARVARHRRKLQRQSLFHAVRRSPKSGGRRAPHCGPWRHAGAGPRKQMNSCRPRDAIEASRADPVFASVEENGRPVGHFSCRGAGPMARNRVIADASIGADEGVVVFVKGSLGSKMAVIVDALKGDAAWGKNVFLFFSRSPAISRVHRLSATLRFARAVRSPRRS